MTRLNAEYRGIHKGTDVLSFEAAIPFAESGAREVLGDIVISVPRAEAQAAAAGRGFYEEVRRLLIHGILHLVGYDHERSAYYERRMKRKEEEIFDATKEVA